MRKRRQLQEGASYYVLARANRDEMILGSDDFKKLFIEVMLRAKKKYSFQFYNFCILGNNIRFILRPSEGVSLSLIMQWILSVFAILYNRRLGLKGHVWYDRFRSEVLGDLWKFLQAYTDVENEPVKEGLAEDPAAYIYGGLYFILNGLWELFML